MVQTSHLLDEADGARAMRWIVAIMLFLTVLAAATGIATRNGAGTLRQAVAGRLTVQLVDGAPDARAALAGRIVTRLRQASYVSRVAPVDRRALTDLLRPWLGADAADPDLPLPVMIDVDLIDTAPATMMRVRAAVRALAPSARIDAHEGWMAAVTALLSLATWIGAAVVALMASATGAVVMLAARAGLDAHRATIEVIHMLGGTDVQIARLFQRRIARDVLIGGAIGGGAGLAVVLLAGGRIAALGAGALGGVTLGIGGWAALALLPPAFALLAMIAARIAVTRALGRIL